MTNQRAWLAGALAVVGISTWYRAHLRPWMYRWGSTPEEYAAGLPGDDLVADGAVRTTRAITVHAPADAVWPWLAQIGEDRAGFYSYSLLERAVGARIRNADDIHPEWQNVQAGDTVWMARRYGRKASQAVAAVEPESFLILVSQDDYDDIESGGKASGSWAFHLFRDGANTRLVVRGSGGPTGHVSFDIPHFVMEQKMLRGIRDRAERFRRDYVHPKFRIAPAEETTAERGPEAQEGFHRII
ncbi:hypothetical protein [Mycobacterium antarcticum]|uniref:hypothetical protein n=1 Tax=Mycolicibacterium sp. TUM20983 TaxID=3023369 RepID=UPI0024E0B3D0|nr:hypothetical protein [Mycolicibacterium sp. TUM20983]